MSNVCEYLESLKWDGKPRIASFFDDYATVANKFDATKWFVSAVARAMKPGCRVDQSLVLCDPQGSGKSKLLRKLGSEFYGMAKDDSWIREFRTEFYKMPEWLRFIAMTNDLWDRTKTPRPRKSIFVLTTNHLETCLDNPRRFWPVTITACDANKIAADRDQLWAEAKHHFDNGGQWWD